MNKQEILALQKKTKLEILKYFEHLNSTVEAKDKEINNLKIQHKEELDNIKSKFKAEVKTNVDAEKQQMSLKVINDHTELLGKLAAADVQIAELQKQLTNLQNGKEDQSKGLETMLKRRADELSRYMDLTGALLKSIQGTTDLAVALNSEYYEKVVK